MVGLFILCCRHTCKVQNTHNQPMADRFDHLAGTEIQGYSLKQWLGRTIWPLWQVWNGPCVCACACVYVCGNKWRRATVIGQQTAWIMCTLYTTQTTPSIIMRRTSSEVWVTAIEINSKWQTDVNDAKHCTLTMQENREGITEHQRDTDKATAYYESTSADGNFNSLCICWSEYATKATA